MSRALPTEALARLQRTLPNLMTAAVELTSPADPSYNCAAWAFGHSDAWWWPEGLGGPHRWPEGVPAEVSVAAFVAAFQTVGYEQCDSDALESGFEKVAIFEASSWFGPSHVTRQLPDGRWASKMGVDEDLVCDTNAQLEGGEFGAVVVVLRRPQPG